MLFSASAVTNELFEPPKSPGLSTKMIIALVAATLRVPDNQISGKVRSALFRLKARGYIGPADENDNHNNRGWVVTALGSQEWAPVRDRIALAWGFDGPVSPYPDLDSGDDDDLSSLSWGFDATDRC